MKVLGFAGYSGSGKTTLIEQLIPRLNAQGLKVSLIKHAHHSFDIDKPGKDSFRHREAGASEVLISSAQRWVLMHELRAESEPSLEEQVQRLSACDVVFVEGYKRAHLPKLEVHRPSWGKPILANDDPNVVALASDAPVQGLQRTLPLLDLNQADAIAEFVCAFLDLKAIR